MEVGFKVDDTTMVVGEAPFLHSFFSTVSHHLEPLGWGTRFPELMNDLFQGRLKHSDAHKVLKDVRIIRKELEQYSPDDVIWDIYDLSLSPPVRDHMNEHITSLANYFVGSSGRDLFEALLKCLRRSIETEAAMTIETVPDFGGSMVLFLVEEEAE